MKKQLLLSSLMVLGLLITDLSYGQQNKSANVSSRSTTSFGADRASQKTGPQANITTTTSTCMSINLPTPTTWSLVNYGTGTGTFAVSGFVNGPNIYGDMEKAMYFDASASANTMITQVYVGFGIAYSATPSKTIAIKIYDGTGGTVGSALGQGTLSMGTIMNDVNNNQYSLLMFPTPVNLPASKKFFVSVVLTGLQWTSTIKDSLSIVSNTSPQTSPTPAWERQSDNNWYNYSNALSWQLSISLLIHPFLTQAPIVATMSTSGNTICAGQSVNYNSAGSTAGTYQWSFGAIPTPTATGATPSAVYPVAGTYTTYMQVTDACGSFGLTSNTITVKTTPTVGAAPSTTTVCSGSNVTLNGSGASTYTWSGGITDGVSFTPSSTTNYTVIGTAANGCTNAAVSGVAVNPTPTVTANASTTNVCTGSNVTLSGGGASTYIWTGGVNNGVAFAPAGPGTYTVIGTAANTCTGSAVVSLTIVPNPTVTASPSSTTVCAGTNVTLNGSGATTYTWTGGITNGVAFAAASTTNYTVTGADAYGCSDTAVAILNVNPSPNVTANASASVICAGSLATLTGGGATTYTWTNGITNGVSFTPSVSNVYTVTGTDALGCTATATVSLAVSNCTGIDKTQSTVSYMTVYPNPNNGDFTISFPAISVTTYIEIIDNIGKLVHSEIITSENQTVRTDLSSGIYFIKLLDN
ncbi:MAG: T9SS type A sorting domain-containing protein, partial [Bacteroidia bacterium]